MTFRVALAFFLAWLLAFQTTGSGLALAEESTPPLLPSPSGADPHGEGPGADVTLPPPPPPPVLVHVVADVTNVQFLMRPALPQAPATTYGEPDLRQYSIGCLAPCDLQVAPGDYFVAVSRNGGRAIANEDPIWVRGPMNLVATYESHSGARVTGVVLTSVFVPLGTLLLIAGASTGTVTCTSTSGGSDSCPQSKSDTNAVAAGAVVAGLGLLIGIPLMLLRDRGSVEVVPQSTAPLPTPGGTAPRKEHASESLGLGLRVAF